MLVLMMSNFSSIFRLSSYMADINSNKNVIIIQPITLQIRAPFQFLTNQRAIKHAHYSESRDAGWPKWPLQFLGCVCGKGVHSWTQGSSSTRAVKVEQISALFHLYLYLFFKSEEHPFFATWHAKYCIDIYGSRLMAKEEKSTFQIPSLLLSSFISNIYTPEKGYYWQNQPNSLKVKGYQEVNSNVKQLLH